MFQAVNGYPGLYPACFSVGVIIKAVRVFINRICGIREKLFDLSPSPLKIGEIPFLFGLIIDIYRI